MDINPELVARAYAIYEYYFGTVDSIESGGSNTEPLATRQDDTLKDFIANLKEMDDDEYGDGDTAKGLRGDEQLREMQTLTPY